MSAVTAYVQGRDSMKLIAYKTYDYGCQTIIPASRTREWMDLSLIHI